MNGYGHPPLQCPVRCNCSTNVFPVVEIFLYWREGEVSLLAVGTGGHNGVEDPFHPLHIQITEAGDGSILTNSDIWTPIKPHPCTVDRGNVMTCHCVFTHYHVPCSVRVSSDAATVTEFPTEHVYVPTTSDGCNERVRILSYLAATPSRRYWMAAVVSLSISASPSLIHVTLVGGDPDVEQFRVKTAPESSCSDIMLTGAVKFSTVHELDEIKGELVLITCKCWQIDAHKEDGTSPCFIRNATCIHSLVLNCQYATRM
jgi:hypothetical protein